MSLASIVCSSCGDRLVGVQNIVVQYLGGWSTSLIVRMHRIPVHVTSGNSISVVDTLQHQTLEAKKLNVNPFTTKLS